MTASPVRDIDLQVAVGNRDLFAALADGWLSPPAGEDGLYAGEGFPVGIVRETRGHTFDVILSIDPRQLPPGQVCEPMERGVHSPGGTRVRLVQGYIPLNAIRGVSVGTVEQSARLRGMAKTLSNIDLALIPRVEVRENVAVAEIHAGRNDMATGCASMPSAIDRIHGALAMGAWATSSEWDWATGWNMAPVRRMQKIAYLPDAVGDALQRLLRYGMNNALPLADRCLWPEAARLFPFSRKDGEPLRERGLIDAIADGAAQAAPWSDALTQDEVRSALDAIEAWREHAVALTSAKTPPSPDWFRDVGPVQAGILLALLRGDRRPEHYGSWRDSPEILAAVRPPAFGIGAVLTGARAGFRHLPLDLQGSPEERRVQTIFAMRACGHPAGDLDWPGMDDWMESIPRPAPADAMPSRP